MSALSKFMEIASSPLYYDDLAEMRVEKKAVEKLADCGCGMVNVLTFNSRKVAKELMTEPRMKSNMRQLLLAWIEVGASIPECFTDARNELAVRACRKLAKSNAFETLKSCYLSNNGIAAKAARYFCEIACDWHKTLYQSFAGLMFAYADELAKEDEQFKALTEEMGEEWGYLPLI